MKNESEWGKKLLDLIDDKEAGYIDFAELIEEAISQREKEIAEKLKKIIQEPYALSIVLSIVNH